VSNVNSILVDTSGGDITLSGLTGGVIGQVIDIAKVKSANDFIIEHVEGDGDQDIYTTDTADKTFSNYGGMRILCNGTNWFQVG
jgi:hypothetical protein